MNIYLAGPMRGRPLFNFPMFDAAAVVLRAAGHTVYAPQEHDRQIGFNEKAELNPIPEQLAEMMSWNINRILIADAIALLPGWTQSTGSRIELLVAKATGKKLYTVSFEDEGHLRPLEIQNAEIDFKMKESA